MPRARAAAPVRTVAVVGLLAALLSGCSTVVAGTPLVAGVPPRDLDLVRDYVAAANAAADAGPEAQDAFLRERQPAGVPPPAPGCLTGVRLHTRLIERTLRPDPDWVPPIPGGRRPDGAVYVVAASVSVTRAEGALLSENVGSKHLVISGDRALSYAPCAR